MPDQLPARPLAETLKEERPLLWLGIDFFQLVTLCPFFATRRLLTAEKVQRNTTARVRRLDT